MKSKAQILEQIVSNPEGTLADIETLKKQLMVERMLAEQKEKLCCLFNQQAIEFWGKYHFCRTRLIRARILVRQLKSAVQDARSLPE